MRHVDSYIVDHEEPGVGERLHCTRCFPE